MVKFLKEFNEFPSFTHSYFIYLEMKRLNKKLKVLEEAENPNEGEIEEITAKINYIKVRYAHLKS